MANVQLFRYGSEHLEQNFFLLIWILPRLYIRVIFKQLFFFIYCSKRLPGFTNLSKISSHSMSSGQFASNHISKDSYLLCAPARHYRYSSDEKMICGSVSRYCIIVDQRIRGLWISNTRQVLHFCMWNFVRADKAHQALSAHTKFQIQKCDTCRVLEIRSATLEVTPGSSTDQNSGHNAIKI